MPDRLQELQRQRALIQEQLAWLDREITAAQGIPPLPINAVHPPQVVAPTTRPTATTSDEAEKILGEFKKETFEVKTDAQRGCLIFFLITMGLLTLGAAIGYYFYGRHLGRWW
jgi:hypothetical protein